VARCARFAIAALRQIGRQAQGVERLGQTLTATATAAVAALLAAIATLLAAVAALLTTVACTTKGGGWKVE
jgi:hypothetical protein